MPTVDASSARTRSLLSGVALLTAAVWPVQHAQDGPVLCPFRALTGLPCPACGLTRSFVYTVHGHLSQAFAAHLFGPALVGLAVIWAVTGGRHEGTRLDPSRWWHGRARSLVVVGGAAWAVYAGLRLLVVAGV